MGRVARFKKVKKGFNSWDNPNTVGVWGLMENGRKHKKRSKTSETLRRQRKKKMDRQSFDVAPDSGDDFDLKDIVGSLRKKPKQEPEHESLHYTSQQNNNKNDKNLVDFDSLPTASVEERKLLQSVERQLTEKPVVKAQGRMEGESKRAYNKRVKLETRQIIRTTAQQARNPEKKLRKKEFLKNKKRKTNNKFLVDRDQDDDEPTVHANNKNNQQMSGVQSLQLRALETAPVFGEQAERPPEFKHLPRGCSKPPERSSSSKHKPLDEGAEQQSMELFRRKVQAQYAVIKRQRRQNRDFHL